jgi:hypothetical protein
MELYEFKILQWQPCARNHGITVARACVCARAAEVSAPVPARCEHRFVRTEAVKGTIFHIECNNTYTLAILHDEIKCKKFDKKVGVVAQGLTIESMQQRMASAVRCSSTAVGLSAFAILE